jgi:predicted transcriptional regulator
MLYTIEYNMENYMVESRFEEMNRRIILVLKKHPEGLTTVEIAGLLKMNRYTITKYIYSLVGAGIITQRVVGPAKICYLSERGIR